VSRVYSTYEAKARFSEILKKVREGQTVRISYHGEEVAEVRPLERETTLEGRLATLRDRGVLFEGEEPAALRPLARKPGALERFLDSRE
jgi:prevent-host-death family protein